MAVVFFFVLKARVRSAVGKVVDWTKKKHTESFRPLPTITGTPDGQASDDLRNVQGKPGFVDRPRRSCLNLKKTERAGKSSETNYHAEMCRMS
jgi:hypothetical protein